MWNRFNGKPEDPKDELPSQMSRRNDDEERYNVSRVDSIASSKSSKKSSTRPDDRDSRGSNPTSTSYSYTTQEQRPGAASASTTSSRATAPGNSTNETHVRPDPAGNASLADRMRRSSASRSSRDQEETRKIRDKTRDKIERSDGRDRNVERRQKRDEGDKKENGSRRLKNGLAEEKGASRGAVFPGQYDRAMPGLNNVTPEHPAMSSHVQDQFPGQFPTQSSAPYRPPLAASEGGPGLAAEYYGDDGQSVVEQPGNRTDTPSLIVGAEPHLQPALAVAAPPPEPSASGNIGAAASFFSGEVEEDEAASTHNQYNLFTHSSNPIRPNDNYHSSSAPVIPIISGTEVGSAIGNFNGSQNSSHQQHQDHEVSIGGAPSVYSTTTTTRPPSQAQGSYHSRISRPPKPGKQQSQSSGIPISTVGIAGAAGLAAVAYEHNHHSSLQDPSSMSQNSTYSMAQRHRNDGPFSALMNFFKDPEGVAQFEEYSEIIGVCRHCFAPGSSPRDAPRKHLHKKRSDERYGNSVRVDKDSRYYSSENEKRRKNRSWLTTGLGGYGLAKVGQNLSSEKNDLGDTYSEKIGRFSPEERKRRARRRSRSKERVEIGTIDHGKSDTRGPRDETSTGTKRMASSARRHSRTRPRSKVRTTGVAESAIGAALESSVVASSSQRRSRSPKGTHGKSKRKSPVISPERLHKTKHKKRDRGFFGFGNGSSSSSSLDLAYTRSQDQHRSSTKSHGKSKDDKKAEAALLGLGAATAALALSDGRQGHKRKGVRELVGAKETKDHDGHGSGPARKSKISSEQQDDELWESAADDYESANSDLAYGAPGRRDSRASLSSESSGTNKWGWRWGRKRNRRASTPRRGSTDYNSFPTVAGAGLIGPATISQDQHQGDVMDSTGGLPLQHVYPVPTSDPSRFDVGRGDSVVSSSRPIMSSRPEAVPLQHPRPVAPVSAAIYSGQTPYDHSFSAPTGPAMFSQTQYQHRPETSDARQNTNEASMPGSFPRLVQQADDGIHDIRLRRRDTSPARMRQDSMSNSMAPERGASTRIDSSAVRFDLTEEQEEIDRRERRRKRKEDRDRREAKEQEKIESDRRASREQSRKKSGPWINTDEGPGGSSETSWVGPAAAGIIGATIGAAAATDKSRSEEMREERRQRRQKERELEDEEDALSKSERRRRQKEQHDQDAAIKDSGRLPDEASTSYQSADHKKRTPKKQEMSVWQEAASTKQTTGHEDYRSFFTPIEVLNKSSDQVKITSANADADIDLEPVPQIVTVKPKRVHDLSDSPGLSLADTDDRIDPSKASFPWQIPKLRLEEPTPPSTRGSTPIPQSKSANDTDFEGSRKKSSSTKVKWEDEQTPEYTVIAPKEDRDESIESVSREINGTDAVDFSESSHEHDFPVEEPHPRTGSITEKCPSPYGEDAEFAATLAASAEDAGFDPSIVINNPTYRRRESPPGSNERSMPGGFDDENEQRRNKKERKKKEASSRRQRQNEDPRQRDDDAVQDIISQAEEIEYQPSYQILSDNHDDDLEDEKKTNSNKSKDGRKGSDPKVHSFEASAVGRQPPASDSDGVLEPTTEDIQSVTSSAPDNDEADSDAQIRKESKNDHTRFDLATSSVPHPSKTENTVEPKSSPKDKRKGSVWDRILGKTTGSLPQANRAEGVTDKAVLGDLDRPKKTQKPTKGKSSRDGNNERDTNERSSVQDIILQVSDRSSQDQRSKDQGSSQPLAFSDAGSVSQYLVHDLESEHIEEKEPEPFLGMRPEPPPPPDTRAESEGVSSPLETASLPTTPHAEFDAQSRRFSDAEIHDPSQTTAGLPSSPTAIPFHFRRPGRSSGIARSLPQTPVPSDSSAVDLSPKQKTRPRSTEFKSSKEIRPLWLVERHRSHQEPRPDEVYPSLPSSHTTSRSSSVHDVEGGESHERDKCVSNEGLEPIEAESAPMISTVSNPIQQSDLLDSQQATPTAPSFQNPKNAKVIPSLQANRDSSSEVDAEEPSQESSSTVNRGVLHAILGGSTAIAINGAVQSKDLTGSDQSQEENDDFEHRSDDIAVDAATSPQYNDTVDQQEDFVLQKTKKGKKNKRNPGQSVETSITRAVETQPSTSFLDPEPLSLETMRQTQERDAQDAVDSWSSVAMPSNERRKGKKSKKGKKGKAKALVERSPEESAPSPNTYQPPRDSPEITMPGEGQEIDTLTTGMSREQIVDVMATAAHCADQNENEKSQSATAVNPEPFEIQEEDDPSESTGKNDEQSRKVLLHDEFSQDAYQTKTLPQDRLSQEDPHRDDLLQSNLTQYDLQEKYLPRHDLPHDQLPPPENHQETYPKGGFCQVSPSRDDFLHSQDPQNERLGAEHRTESLPVLSPSSPAMVTSMTPFSENAPGDVLESPNANPASQEELGRGDLPTVMLPPLELSPRSTPLPYGEDHDLLEEQAGISGPTSQTYANDKAMDIAATETPSGIPYVADPSAIPLEQQQKLQDLPSHADQVDDGDDYTFPSKRKSKKSKKVKQSFLVEDLETPGSQEEEHSSLSNPITSTKIGNDLSKVLNDEPPIETTQTAPKVTEDERVSFTSNKKGKKAKKAKRGFSSSENGKAIEVEEGQDSLPEVALPEAPEDPEATRTTYQSAVVVSQPEALPIEHETLGSNGKKGKTSVSVNREYTSSIGDEKEKLSRVVPPKTSGYDEAPELINDSATRAPKADVVEETTDLIDELTSQVQKLEVVVDDESVGPNSEKRRESLKRQRPETAGEAPVPDETEPQLQPQTGARNDMIDRSSSLATTRTSQDVGAILGIGGNEASLESETSPVEVQAVRTFPKLYDQIPSNDERNLPVLYEPEVSQFQDAPRKAHDDETHPARDTSVASTNTAQAVHGMLVGESNAESAVDAKREVMAASAGMEETAFNVGNSEEDELVRTSSRKKKKGKRRGKLDAKSLDEPETIDTTETTGPLGARDILLEERPPADPTIEENEPDRDAPKKKKRGKKGKKSEELILDEPEIMNPVKSLSASTTTNRPPLEQQPTAETIEEAFTKQSKKDKKTKKGKRKGVSSAVSDIRDEYEPESVPPEVSQDENKVKDFATSVNYLQEETDGNILLTKATQDDTRFKDDQATTRSSRNDVEPCVVPTEPLQDNDQTKERYAEDHLSVTSEIRNDPEPNIISTEVPGDDEMPNLPTNFMTPIRAEGQALEEKIEPAMPTELIQADGTKKAREVPMEEEHNFVPPRGKRDKKKFEKSEKPSVFFLDDNEIPAFRDGHLAETQGLPKDGIEQAVPSSNVGVVEEPEETAQRIQSDLDQDLRPPKTKKDKEKSKTSDAVPPKRDISPVLEIVPSSKSEDDEGDAPKQTRSSNVEVFKEPEQSVESLPEEKKDREETEAARPFDWENVKVTPQSEKDAAQRLNKDSDTDAIFYPSNSVGNAAMAQGKRNEDGHEYIHPVSAYAAASEAQHEIASPRTSSLEEAAGNPEETTNLRLNTSQGNIVPAVEPRTNPLYTLEPSKEDNKGFSISRHLTWEDESSQDRKDIFKGSYATEDHSNPSTIPVSQDAESWSKPEISAEDVEPTNIVQPGMKSEEDQAYQGNVVVDQSSQSRDQIPAMVEAEHDKKSQETKSEKLSITEPEEAQYPADEVGPDWVMGISRMQTSEQASEHPLGNDVNTTREMGINQNHSTGGVQKEVNPILMQAVAVDEAKEEDLAGDTGLPRADKSEEHSDHGQWDESKIEDSLPSAINEPVRETVETFQKADNVPDIKSIPALEVEMLDAQEQRDYNDEYAKELERQLSPSQDGNQIDPLVDQADVPMFTQSSMNRPLAQPPALEDIIEESRSSPGPIQASPANRQDDFSTFKSGKKGKKGKKGRKQQPIVWEDETATPSLEPESDPVAKTLIKTSKGPGFSDADDARPFDLDESIDQQSIEDRRLASPHGDLNNAFHERSLENDRADDYFTIQPRKPAEEDVGREDSPVIWAEPPYSSRDRSPAQEPQTDAGVLAEDDPTKDSHQHEELRSHATDFHHQMRTEVDPAKTEVEDILDPAPVKETEEDTLAKQNNPTRELRPQALGQEDFMNQPKRSEIPIEDTSNEPSLSRQHSLQRYSHDDSPEWSAHDELPLVAKSRSTSRDRSGSRGNSAAAVYLSELADETMSRRDSKKQEKREKAKRASRRTESEAEISEAESHLDRGQLAVEKQEHGQIPEPESTTGSPQYHRTTTTRSPPSASYEANPDESLVGDLGQLSEKPGCRDSAIHVFDSPVVSEEIPYHRAARDSGYPDTETSPKFDDEPGKLEEPADLNRPLDSDESIKHWQHPRSHGPETDERQRSISRDALEISREASSYYDVSVPRPKEKQNRSRRKSEAAYDSDDSADSGFDIQRRRRRQAMAAEPREPSPVSSTTKDRSSALFDSSPSAREDTVAQSQDQDVSPGHGPIGKEPPRSVDREILPQQQSREASREGRSASVSEHAPESKGDGISTGNQEDTESSLFGGPRSYEDDSLSRSRSPLLKESRSLRRLNIISEHDADGSALHKKDKRAMSDVGSPESDVEGRRTRSATLEDDGEGRYVASHQPISVADEEQGAVAERNRSLNSDELSTLSGHHGGLAGVRPKHRDDDYRTRSAASVHSETENSIYAIIRTPDQIRSASGLSYRSSATPTPPLRRVDRSASGDLRGRAKKNKITSSSEEFQVDPDPDPDLPSSSSTHDPITDKATSSVDMANVYEGLGDARGQSSMSPTRPPSMRKRQSMQLLDLETRLDQIVSENRLLASQKLTAERALEELARDHSQERHAYEEAMQEHKIYLERKDSELGELKQIIEHLHDQAAHLTEVNEGLVASQGANEEHEQRYAQLSAEHAHTREQWQQSARNLEDLREQHTQLSTGMEDIVRHEVNVALDEKNLELRGLQSELENAKQQVRDLQQQLLASRNSDSFVERDEDYFDSQCQSLCQHVQQWVLRFSKFSDMKACYLASVIKDEKVVDRMENAVLDGTDVDDYLSDRVKRRDVFMSVVMTMIWEFIFTRYLFGMDREQRQKLKNLEKTLQGVGPTGAVHKWRATTLTLLMKREAFENQRATDTEAVVHEIYDTLATFLPPPSHLVGQIQDSLRKVIDTAVDLSIEMRTQRAEYTMLPPLQPEYDTNGDLARKVYFSALTMNERSGATSSNEALQEQHAVVRMVLFPLVVKNEDDDEQIVVCPAQVLTAEASKGKKTVRVLSAQGGRSEASLAGSDVRMEGGMI